MWTHVSFQSYDSSKMFVMREPTLRTEKFREFARREIALWEEIYGDFLALGSHLLVLHFEVKFIRPTTNCTQQQSS